LEYCRTELDNAPANNTGSAHEADLTKADLLGTFQLDYNGDKASPTGTSIHFSSQALVDFLNADSNGQATIILGRTGSQGGRNLLFAGDTHASYPPPMLSVSDIVPPISVLSSGSKVVIGPKVSTLSFNAGAKADKLVVGISSEASGGAIVVTHNGDPLTFIPGSNSGRQQGIWYLDDPFTGGAANLTVDMSAKGVVNGIAFGVVPITKSKPGFAEVASTTTNSVSLTPTKKGSLVLVNYGTQGGSRALALSPLVQLYGRVSIGSAEGAAGYVDCVPASLQTYSFSGGGSPMGVGAAAFAPDPTTVVRFK
jgi:hypothetical protein